MTTALGTDLILDMNRSDTGIFEILHRTDNVDRIAVAGIRINNHRDIHRARHIAGGRHHLGFRNQPDIRQPKLRQRHVVTAQVSVIKTRPLDNLGVYRCIDTHTGDESLILHQRT